MFVTLMTQEGCHTVSLPSSRNGQYWLRAVYRSSGEKLLSIEAINGEWCILSTETAVILDEHNAELSHCALHEFEFYKVALVGLNQYAYIFTESNNAESITFTKCSMKNTPCILRIGKEPGCDICYSNPMVSSSHAELVYQEGVFRLVDTNSTNGTFVNNRRIEKQVLSAGDVIYIMGLRIIIGTDFFAYNNPAKLVEINSDFTAPFLLSACETKPPAETRSIRYFSRSPQFRTKLVPCEMQIELPPQKQQTDDMPLHLSIGPALTVGLASAATALFAVNQAAEQGNFRTALPSVIMAGSMVAGSLIWPVLSRRFYKRSTEKKEARRRSLYRQYIDDRMAELDEAISGQIKALRANYISAAECLRRIAEADRQLWERANGGEDFLMLRLGTGEQEMAGSVVLPQEKIHLIDDPLIGEMKRLMAKPRILPDVPVVLSLFRYPVIGVNGSREARNALLRNLILQIITLYGYDYVKLVLLLDERDAPDFEFVRSIPHIWDGNRKMRYFGVNDNEVKEISIALETEFDTVSYRMHDSGVPFHSPYYVILSLDPRFSHSMGILRKVLESKQNMGFSLVFSAEALRDVPKECSRVIYADPNGSYVLEKENLQEKTAFFSIDGYCGREQIAHACSVLSNIRLHTGSTSGLLPDTVTFLDLYGVRKIEHLNIMERWKTHDPTISLECPVGRDEHGNLFVLDLHQNIHGPHGLIAGMTGSGKSEFIITYILSMAINYHPSEVAFVLIDYKGGGMAKTFERLPHTVGIITNLDGAGVNRSLVSVKSELARRQEEFLRLSSEIGESNIDIYKYQKLYRSGAVEKPMPHLFIISDEFAELKQQHPDFMEQLESIARIGRSLGVHMILATQKPDGVVDDQIWSNSRFKVCLKVQTKEDSMRMLSRPDAASLVKTGRFYLQVGYNDLFEMGQSAWAGAPYADAGDGLSGASQEVSVIDNIGRTVISHDMAQDAERSPQKLKKQVDEITAYISRIASEEKISIPKLWCETMPPHIDLEALMQKYAYAPEPYVMEPVIGELDDPRKQKQYLCTAPVSREGNILICGAVGSGKTMLLYTMLYSLLCSHSAAELNVYIMDFDAETMTAFSRAPQVGGVVLIDETDKTEKLLMLLTSEIAARKKRYVDYGGDYAAYNRKAAQKEPAVLLVINTLNVFEEMCEDKMNTLIRIARNGSKYGVYVIAARIGSFGARYQLTSCFPQRIILQSSDEAEYTNMLGKTEGLVPAAYEGRGLIRTEDGILEFQTAQIAEESVPVDLIQSFCAEIAARANTPKAKAIPVVPEHVDTAFLLEHAAPQADSLRVPVGVFLRNAEVCVQAFSEEYLWMVLSQNGRNQGYLSNVTGILSKHCGVQCTVLDPNGTLSVCRSHAVYAEEAAAMEQQIVTLYELTLSRHKAFSEAEKNGAALPQFERKAVILNGLRDIFASVSFDRKDKLEAVLEFGKKEYGICVFISDSETGLNAYCADDWYKKQVTEQDAVWIGRGLNRCLRIRCSRIVKDDAIAGSCAFVIRNSDAELIKIPVQ